MELKDRKRFLELKKKYGVDMAIVRQQDPDLCEGMDEDEMFKTFLLFETERTLVEAINSHLDGDSSAGAVGAICVTLTSTILRLLDQSKAFLTSEEINKIKNLIGNFNYKQSDS